MKLQTIKSLDGKDEYVLLPMPVYKALKDEIEDEIAGHEEANGPASEYVPFVLEDYIDNPISLARVRAKLTQKELAERLGVSQAYISKMERAEKVSPRFIERVNAAVQSV